VFGEADEGDVAAWMRQLEDEEGLSPLWEVFFQIAAYPVPQVLLFVNIQVSKHAQSCLKMNQVACITPGAALSNNNELVLGCGIDIKLDYIAAYPVLQVRVSYINVLPYGSSRGQVFPKKSVSLTCALRALFDANTGIQVGFLFPAEETRLLPATHMTLDPVSYLKLQQANAASWRRSCRS